MSDVLSSVPGLPGQGLGWRDGLRMARRHLLLVARLQRQTARWMLRIYPDDQQQRDRAKRKTYKAWVARQLARDLRAMEKKK